MEVMAALQEASMVDAFSYEDLNRTPFHKQDACIWCGSAWYLSEGKLRYHQMEKTKNPRWKFPTSCPDCRKLSKSKALENRKSNCPSNKREFDTAADADTYQRLNKEKYGGEPQHSYYCPQCHNYHLSSKEPVTTPSSGSLTSSLAKVAQMEMPVGKRKERKAGESRAEVARLLGLGHSTAEIASRLNMTQTNVSYHKRNIEGAPSTTKPAVVDVEALDADDLDATAERLRLQLEEIQRKKVRLAEAKMLRVELVNGAIKIVKEGEHMLLPFAERDQLVQLLTQL